MAYWNGHLAEEDRKAVEDWVSNSEENRVRFEQLHSLYLNTQISLENYKPNVEKAWSSVESKLKSQQPKQVLVNWTTVYRVAAAIVLLVGVGIFTYQLTQSDSQTIRTHRGEVRELLLSDGTQVILNEQSSFVFNSDFNKKDRSVELIGQAYFKVTKDQSRPFIISGGSALVQVKGTAFDFKTDNGYSEVNVTEGVVEMIPNGHPNQKLVLTRNERGVLVDNNLIKTDGVNRDALVWRLDELTFKSTPLSEVVKLLAEHFSVEFKLSEGISSCLITSSFEKQSLEEILGVLKAIANIENRKEGNIILLSGPGC